MELSRRQLLQAAVILGGVAVTGAGCSPVSGRPSASVWDGLRAKVGDRLIRPMSPLAACVADAGSAACTDAMARMQNPFYLQDEAGATQTQGWLDAWTTAVSPYAVAAASASDIVAAVDFAREHDVKLVIKGTGHDYLGRSSAPDSLLVWTHHMRDVDFSDDFVIDGGTGPGVPALTVQAGARWLEAYTAATEVGRYVQGGGCTSVGASGGFLQGSGYGSFSKRFGTGAGNVLEFEVVTADGSVRVANAVQNPDLFWALRGGGAATWGVVTKTTLLAHPMPHVKGLLSGTIEATTTAAYRDLLVQLCRFIPRLINPSWGEQITFGGTDEVALSMVFLDLSVEEARAVWEPMVRWLDDYGSEITSRLAFSAIPFEDYWNAAYYDETNPGYITHDPRDGAPESRFWWSGTQSEVSQYIASYQSRWLPATMFDRPEELADLMFEASRHNWFALHLNKGLSGESPAARTRDEQTAIHPAAFDAAALILSAQTVQHRYPGIRGSEPDAAALAALRRQVDDCMGVFREALPDAGSYMNEADYFEADWQDQFWGANYERLLRIKRDVDPGGLFTVHHGVGSDSIGAGITGG